MPYILPILTEAAHLQYIFQYLESCEPILSTSPLRASEILRFKVLTNQNMEKIARCACHGGWALAQNPGFDSDNKKIEDRAKMTHSISAFLGRNGKYSNIYSNT